MESYAATPQGCEEHPDATWEPDECLPDELDVTVACIYSTQNALRLLHLFALSAKANFFCNVIFIFLYSMRPSSHFLKQLLDALLRHFA